MKHVNHAMIRQMLDAIIAVQIINEKQLRRAVLI